MKDPRIEAIARRFPQRWLQGYARGKLRTDPVYQAVLELLHESSLPIMDVGCGIGLLPFFLREHGLNQKITGVDFDEKKIRSARTAAAGAGCSGVEFHIGDAAGIVDFQGNVTLLDVLHYLPQEAQAALLESLAKQVAPGGFCIIRDVPRDSSWRFRVTQAEEWFVRAISWMKQGAQHYATIEEISAPFRRLGFQAEIRPLWGGTPFNSYLFVFQRPPLRRDGDFREAPPELTPASLPKQTDMKKPRH